jgi:predicted transcriptional regulator
VSQTTDDLLRSIQKSLDEIKAIFVLVNQKKLGEVKKSLLKEGSIKLRIYDLCDGTKTTREIAELIQKDSGYVHSYLSILRREGLIRTIERGGSTVHEQTF